jgi:integrase
MVGRSQSAGSGPALVPYELLPERRRLNRRAPVAPPLQDIKIWDIQDRTSRSNATRPWVVRWKVDGAERSRAFRTKAEADHVRARLMIAAREGELFDRPTGLPVSWQPAPEQRRLHSWVREWLAEQWPEWQPRTRTSAVEALSRFVPAVYISSAAPAPRDLRRYLVDALRPEFRIDEHHACERWLSSWSPPLDQLAPEMMARAERQLGTGLRGQLLGASVVDRYRKVAHAAIIRAVDLRIIDTDPWPPPPRGRRTRKSNRRRRSVDVRRLPEPDVMANVIDAIRSHHPASRTYQVMTAVAYYGGLRPSEVVMLRSGRVLLPSTGWGTIEVAEADIGWDVSGEPKTGPRSVPVPPILVTTLARWVDDHAFAEDDLLFRTRTGKRPTASNWSRALKRACAIAGCRPLRIYDCRHAAATTWLRAGVPLATIALRLGHSVETLVSTYVGALDGDEEIANERIETALGDPTRVSVAA